MKEGVVVGSVEGKSDGGTGEAGDEEGVGEFEGVELDVGVAVREAYIHPSISASSP